jgi:hypothetical protein
MICELRIRHAQVNFITKGIWAMKVFNTFIPCHWLPALSLILVSQSVFAADYSGYISEEYLRSQFTFKAGDSLKYSQCEKKSHPTCTYIWGPDYEKDAARVKAGLPPEGNKLQIVYAQGRSQKNFERVLNTYSDAEVLAGIGEEAVWSEKRHQLSFITDENLIVHINIDVKDGQDSKEDAVAIAGDLLEQL